MPFACRTLSEPDRDYLWKRYLKVRDATQAICSLLEPDDHGIQSMPDVSPPKWHLAHTSWFFETFVLEKWLTTYQQFHPSFGYLFNSYYKGLGSHHPRAERGLLSRPPLSEIHRYRKQVDARMETLLQTSSSALLKEIEGIVELGLHHEEQHQELLLTDIKYNFYSNPLKPSYKKTFDNMPGSAASLQWIECPEGIRSIGHDGPGFSFDNERPRHRFFLEDHRLASRPVTNAEYLEFMVDGGYQEPRLWLSDGWDALLKNSWKAPLYWEKGNGSPNGLWETMTLSGMRPLNLQEPVVHVSFYEADAYARWAKARLPSESEWEAIAVDFPIKGNFLESGLFHASPASGPQNVFSQIFGDVWEWTSSPYIAYPGFKPNSGNVAEYNGKFMCNQMVLRGGSCATPVAQIRPTYRNFFPPHARWQFSGIRLARDS